MDSSSEKICHELAKRNGWSCSFSDGRPYFMENGNYAVPNELTSDEDKELLAEIISEGSDEMKKLILLCWSNDIVISGPCSGIAEFHSKKPIYLHFSFKANPKFIRILRDNLLACDALKIEQLKMKNPKFAGIELKEFLSEGDEMSRLDFNYWLKDQTLTQDESNYIFAHMREQLEYTLRNFNSKKY